MKKFISVLCCLSVILTASLAEARPHHGGFGPALPPAPHWKALKHHHHNTAGFVAGLVGGSLISYLAYNNQPQTVTASYAPVQYVPSNSQTCYTQTNIVTGAQNTYCTNNTVITSAPTVTTPTTNIYITN